MSLINWFIKKYGDATYLADLIFSIAVVVILVLFGNSFGFVGTLLANINESTISFLGILIGFLLTTFSLLFLYNPEHSEELTRLRKHKEYKNMLYALISTAFITLLLTVSLLIFTLANGTHVWIYWFLFALILFTMLRIFKCIFYLFLIIELS